MLSLNCRCGCLDRCSIVVVVVGFDCCDVVAILSAEGI